MALAYKITGFTQTKPSLWIRAFQSTNNMGSKGPHVDE